MMSFMSKLDVNRLKLLVFQGAVFLFLMSGCISRPDRLEYALEFAGKNRVELEKVLEHYKGDTMKYRAACFLIENMTHCYSYLQGGDMDSVKKVRTYTNSFGQLDEEYIHRWGYYDYRNLPKIYDAHIISADYLIENIEHAFEMWHKRSWNKNLSFDDFCEYLLPYRIGNEPLETWRKRYEEEFGFLLDSVYTGGDVIHAVNIISHYLLNPVFIYNEDFSLPHIGPTYLFKHRFGTCVDAADIMIYTLRSIGIPCVEDTDSKGSHVWVAIRDTTGRDEHLWYFNGEVIRGNCDMGGHKRGKVFRQTTGIQDYKMKYYGNEWDDLPVIIKHPYVKDVSRFYFPDTLRANLGLTDDIYYVSYFKDRQWEVCAAVYSEDGKVTVPNLESGLIYLLHYQKEGILYPATYPIWFSTTDTEILQPDTTRMQRVKLYRKFPFYRWIKNHLNQVLGASVDVSLHRDFDNYRTLFTLTDSLRMAYNRVNLSRPVRCRYVRFRASAEKQAQLAELSVFSEGKVIPPVSISGSAPQKNNKVVSLDNVSDQDPLTYFTSEKKGGEIVLDLGNVYSIDRIDFMPRNDDNFIRKGDLYELYYHGGTEGWKRILRDIADTTFLEVDVPSKALLWLRDLSRGKEEHIFFMKGEEQKFPVF